VLSAVVAETDSVVGIGGSADVGLLDGRRELPGKRLGVRARGHEAGCA